MPQFAMINSLVSLVLYLFSQESMSSAETPNNNKRISLSNSFSEDQGYGGIPEHEGKSIITRLRYSQIISKIHLVCNYFIMTLSMEHTHSHIYTSNSVIITTYLTMF